MTTSKQIDDAIGILRTRGHAVQYAVRNGIVWVMVDERWFTYGEVCDMAGIAFQQPRGC